MPVTYNNSVSYEVSRNGASLTFKGSESLSSRHLRPSQAFALHRPRSGNTDRLKTWFFLAVLLLQAGRLSDLLVCASVRCPARSPPGPLLRWTAFNNYLSCHTHTVNDNHWGGGNVCIDSDAGRRTGLRG